MCLVNLLLKVIFYSFLVKLSSLGWNNLIIYSSAFFSTTNCLLLIDFIKKPFLVEEILLKTDIHISQSDYLNQISIQSKELEEYKRILNGRRKKGLYEAQHILDISLLYSFTEATSVPQYYISKLFFVLV